MPKKAGAFIVAMGAVLILSALLLFACNLRENIRAGQEAESLLTDVRAAIAAQAAPPAAAPTDPPAPDPTEPPEEPTDPTEPPPDPEMPTVYLGGYDYLGYLALPTLGLELPVMASWDYPRLKISPCRQFGSTRTDDLVIAAHNYGTHFGRLKVDMADGKLEVLLVRSPRSLLELTECIAAVQSQQYNNCEMITFRSGSEIRITADPNMPWTLDGEREDGHREIRVVNNHLAYRLVQKRRD